jgi:hypothetical protein
MSETGTVSYRRVVISAIAIALSLWPLWLYDFIDVNALQTALLNVFAIFAGVMGVLMAIERNIDWLRQYSWRRASVERRIAEQSVNRQSLLLLLYVVTIVLILGRMSIKGEFEAVRKSLAVVYLFSGSLCLLWTLSLPFEIRRMRLLPYEDVLSEKAPLQRNGGC